MGRPKRRWDPHLRSKEVLWDPAALLWGQQRIWLCIPQCSPSRGAGDPLCGKGDGDQSPSPDSQDSEPLWIGAPLPRPGSEGEPRPLLDQLSFLGWAEAVVVLATGAVGLSLACGLLASGPSG